METHLSLRGTTVVPAELRRRYQLRGGDRLVWFDEGGTLCVIPIPGDPIAVLRGRGKGRRLLAKLMADRKRDRTREPLVEGSVEGDAHGLVLAREADETFTVPPELEAELLESIAEADRGETITADELLRRLKSD